VSTAVRPALSCAFALLAIAILVSLPSAAGGAQSPERTPVSLARGGLLPLEAVAARSMPRVDVAALLEEDAANGDRYDIPFRVGYAMPSDLSPANSGTWESLPEGGSVWRLRVRSEGALWIALGFGTFRPDEGGRLWVYGTAAGDPIGPYGASDIRSHGQLWLPPVNGDVAVIELYWPGPPDPRGANLHLGTVSHGYKAWGGYGEFGLPGGGADEAVEIASGSCNVDVNCPLGDDWQDQKRGVARLLIGGSGLCSGSLIGTTAGDCHPYFLTAQHCIGSQSAAASTVFRFNYERPLCGSGVPSTNDTISGSDLVATYSASDMTLLELSQPPAESFGAYFNGWSRSTQAASESTGIHHPGGDYKKICYNEDPLVNGQNWGSDHWRVTEWEIGTTEGGSSGSPLFDQDHRIVGQLHGGTASCSSLTYDEYGKLDVSWYGGGTSASRLRDWLDPIQSGGVAIDGLDHSFCLRPRPVLGYVSHVAQETVGNGNGTLDPGEVVHLEVLVVNNGSVNATEVRGVLGGAEPLLGIPHSTAAWPDIPKSETRSSAGPGFDVALDPAYPCGEPLRLTLELTAAETADVWVSELELPIGAAVVDERFRDDMEAGAGGWTSQALVGADAWVLVTAQSASPTHSWFIADTLSRRDTALVLPVIEALPPYAVLRFKHRFDTEANRDGGVLEYSTDGGTSWLDAGPLLVEGGYASAVGSDETSTLAGRSVWSGDSGGWQSVRADLSSLAGNDLSLRWRFATNLLVGDVGWYVDDVVVDVTSFTCAPVALPPGEASDPLGPGENFMIEPDPAGYALSWSAPASGGAALEYILYGVPLHDPSAGPACESDLGSSTSALLPALTGDCGFLIVARNSAGEGSLGWGSDGLERPPAQGAAVCP